ncbi:MAG: hypothetical protein ACRCY4_10630 [Brevinema sp.]
MLFSTPSIVLNGHTYAIYQNTKNNTLNTFRASGDRLLITPAGTSIAILQENFEAAKVANPDGFHRANRQK